MFIDSFHLELGRGAMRMVVSVPVVSVPWCLVPQLRGVSDWSLIMCRHLYSHVWQLLLAVSWDFSRGCWPVVVCDLFIWPGLLKSMFSGSEASYPAIHISKNSRSSGRQQLIAFSYWPQKSSSVLSASFFWLQWISSVPGFKGRGWLHLSMGRWRRACRMGDVVAAIFGKYSLPQSLYLHTWLIILLFSH